MSRQEMVALREELRAAGITEIRGVALGKCSHIALFNKREELLQAKEVWRVSPSQISTYQKCGRQWMYRYIHKLKSPYSPALVLGQSIHEALEINYKNKLFYQEDLAYSEVEGYFVNAVQAREQETIWADSSQNDIIETGRRALKFYYDTVAVNIFPKVIEHKFTFPIMPGFEMTGIIDLIDQEDRIIDHKTSARASWNQEKADRALGLTIYSMAASESNKLSQVVRIDSIVCGKTPKIEQFTSVRNAEDYYRAMTTIRSMIKGIQAGIYMPAQEDHWCCTKKFCSYFDRCQEDMIKEAA